MKTPRTRVKNERVHYAVSQALRRMDLTQKEAANILGLSPQTVCNYVSSGIFSRRTAERWSAVLNIPIETFLNGELPPPPEQYDVIKRDVEALKSDIEFLKQEIRQLREAIEHETTASC